MKAISHPLLLEIILLSLSLLLLSCGDNSTGTGDNGSENDNSGDNPPEPSFSNVLVIFTDSCGGSGCHIGERTNGVRLDRYDNVIESEGMQYNKRVVQPGDADASPLIDKISPGTPEHGVRMPAGGPYLSEDQIDLIRVWINNGAEDDES